MQTAKTARTAASTLRQVLKRQPVVRKYGGSSVGSASAMRAVASQLAAAQRGGEPTVAVLSAVYGVTDRLLGTMRAAKEGDAGGAREMRAELMDVHHRTSKELLGEGEAHDTTMHMVEREVALRLDSHMQELLDSGSCALHGMDEAASLGERLSTLLLSRYMQRNAAGEGGVSGEYVPADELIVTDGVHGGAVPDLEASKPLIRDRLTPLLKAGVVPLVTGFLGRGPDGRVTTLGRGGSDLSAAVLGYALDAKEVALYKVESESDEQGWLASWQPGWVGVVHDVDSSATIEKLSYEEAAQLAQFGKKVLHPRTVQPAVASGIPVVVRNTMDVHHPGTVIGPQEEVAEESESEDPLVRTVTSISVDKFDAANNTSLADQHAGCALVCMVGPGIFSPDRAWQAASVLEEKGISTTLPARVNGSEHNCALLVSSEQARDAVKLLHSEFVDSTL